MLDLVKTFINYTVRKIRKEKKKRAKEKWRR